MFEILSTENSQHITLHDRFGLTPVEAWIIGRGTKAIAYAVICYAKKHNVLANHVGYSVRPTLAHEV